MKVLFPFVLFFFATLALAAVTGSFAGTVVSGPEQSTSWIYVEGHNHSVRRVNVTRAKVRYSEEVPLAERKEPVPALTDGTEVRVTAEQDESGEWRATEVDILKPAAGSQPQKKQPATTTSQS